MEHPHDNPILAPRNHPAPTGYSKPCEMPKPSAQTLVIIRQLDTRFPPNASTSEEDRETQVLLLASDVTDIATPLLEAASREWVRTKAFMPKASELRAIASDIRVKKNDGASDYEKGCQKAERLNAEIESDNDRRRRGIRWIYETHSGLKLVPVSEYDTWRIGLVK